MILGILSSMDISWLLCRPEPWTVPVDKKRHFWLTRILTNFCSKIIFGRDVGKNCVQKLYLAEMATNLMYKTRTLKWWGERRMIFTKLSWLAVEGMTTKRIRTYLFSTKNIQFQNLQDVDCLLWRNFRFKLVEKMIRLPINKSSFTQRVRQKFPTKNHFRISCETILFLQTFSMNNNS